MLPSEITNAGKKANDLAYQAATDQAGSASVADILKQKIQDAYSQNQDIVKPLDQATADYYASPAVARDKYQEVFNPFAREKLVSQYTGNAALPMLSLSNILGNRIGRISDTLGAGVDAYSAKVGQETAAAQLAQNAYNNLLNEYQIKSSIDAANTAALKQNQQVVEANGRKYLVATDSQGHVTSKVDLGSAPAGAGSSTPDLSALLALLLPKTGSTGTSGGPTETKPTTQLGPVSSFSPQGQWAWDFTTHDWYPVTN